MSILLIGGTTEGREAAAVLDESGEAFVYSTLTGKQQVAMHHGETISGALTAADVARMAPSLVIDASHPYAVEAHRMAVDGARMAGVPVVRIDRPPLPGHDGVTYCDSYGAAVKAMEADGVGRLLALSGVRTIARLSGWWRSHPDTIFRILDRDESREEAATYGFQADRLCYYSGSEDDTGALIERLRPDAIITKDSGRSGGFEQKVRAALDHGVRVYVVCRPQLPDGYSAIVYGPVGLRRAVQTLLPGFFKLRIGLTTGTSATAAAVAAARLLMEEPVEGSVTVVLPSGEPVDVPVKECGVVAPGKARGVVEKDGGDDPDVTTGLDVVAEVELLDGSDHVAVAGGEGVGTVTLPGLGIPVGEAAINQMPRKMIVENVSAVLCGRSARVTVSVPRGREIAARTFNPRLGVVDGISIIGTSGVVRPFSNEAFVESLRRQIDVAIAGGCTTLVLNSGAKSERVLRETYGDVPPVGFIHYGNLIGDAVKAAADADVKNVVLGIMIGKLVKLAAGHLDTHSSGVVMSHEFILSAGRDAGLSDASLKAIAEIKLARELWTLLATDANAQNFYNLLLAKAHSVIAPLAGNMDVTLRLIPDTP